MLVVSYLMILLMDNWLGLGTLTLYLSGRGYDWLAAYGPLHKSIGLTTGDDKDPEEGEGLLDTGETNKD